MGVACTHQGVACAFWATSKWLCVHLSKKGLHEVVCNPQGIDCKLLWMGLAWGFYAAPRCCMLTPPEKWITRGCIQTPLHLIFKKSVVVMAWNVLICTIKSCFKLLHPCEWTCHGRVRKPCSIFFVRNYIKCSDHFSKVMLPSTTHMGVGMVRG